MRKYFSFALVLIMLVACKDKVICPAFQSTYILDDSTRMAYFSYVWQLDKQTREDYFSTLKASVSVDSLGTPSQNDINGNQEALMPYYAYAADYVQPPAVVNKTKYGIVRYEPMWLKNYHLKTAPMENVLGPDLSAPISPEPIDRGEFVAEDFRLDSLQTDIALQDSIETEPIDTVTRTGIPVIAERERPKKPEPVYLYGYDPNKGNNVEQEYYNKYFGKLLISQRPATPKAAPEPKQTPTDSTAAKPPKEPRRKRDQKTEEETQPEVNEEEDDTTDEVEEEGGR